MLTHVSPVITIATADAVEKDPSKKRMMEEYAIQYMNRLELLEKALDGSWPLLVLLM